MHEPEHAAVIDHYDSWTYGELNRRSNQVARSLIDRGIGRGDVVAVLGRRCASLVWAVFGILKTGAAFLILDPAYPAARLIQYLRLAGARGFVVLEDSSGISDALQDFVSQNVRCRITLPALSALNAHHPLETYSADDPEIQIGPNDLAYLSFTSGSTGEPKGVLGRHGSLSHFLPWQQEMFGLNETDRFSLLSGLAHDPLQRDMFTPIWVGATLCIPESDMIGTSRLAQWMADSKLTFAHLTPALAELLATSAAEHCRLPSLRHVFFVGDKLTRRDVARLRCLAPAVTCIGSYGATETQRAVGIKLIRCSSGDDDGSQREVYPLGRGAKDAQLLVLNRARQLAGIGELGEIYIRSPHLAIGYLDADLTQEKFQTNRFTGVPDDRLYKTGDLGRYLPDGEVEFAGRADRQIKIRGFRVEPEEIEAALGQHPSVKQAIVALRDNGADQSQIVAYVVPGNGDRPPAGDLRQFLRSRVPHYMVPNAFAFLEALPLTPNGKLDLHALPPVAPDQVSPEKELAGVESEIERAIARIWQDVLHASKVRVDDNFFDLGGQSLLAVRVISRLREELQIDIPLRLFFENPTIRSLAASLHLDLEKSAAMPEMAQILADLESLSDDEAERLVSTK
jgi:amino acid adenylation domain-containing protein